MKKKFTVAAGLANILFLASWTAINAARIQKERTLMVNKSTPILHVKSVEPGLKFWTERFGFRKTIEVPEGDHIGFVALENDKVEIMYQTYWGVKPGPPNPLQKPPDRGPASFFREARATNAIAAPLKEA